MPHLITAKELGKYMKLSDSTIYKLASSGELPGFKIGDSWRFDLEEVLNVIKGEKQKTLLGERVRGRKMGRKEREND